MMEREKKKVSCNITLQMPEDKWLLTLDFIILGPFPPNAHIYINLPSSNKYINSN